MANPLREALLKYKEEHPGVTHRDIARSLGIPEGSVHRMLAEDHKPWLATALEILPKLGWDFRRARPDYDPMEEVLREGEVTLSGKLPREVRLAVAQLAAKQKKAAATSARRAGIRNCGKVAAGDSSVVFESVPGAGPEEMDFPALEDVFREKSRHLGDVVFYLTVAGTSMEPTYPDGAWVLCRRVTDPAGVVDGCDVIFRETNRVDHYTFKRLQRLMGKGGEVVKVLGVALNREHAILQWEPTEVEVFAVVLGCIKFAPQV